MYRPKSAITQHLDIQHLIYIYFGFKTNGPFLLKERAVSLMLKDRVLNVYVLFILF